MNAAMGPEKLRDALAESLALLRSKTFGPYLACNFIASVGSWMQSVAEPWLILSLTGSAFLVGLDSFMANGPILLLTVAGGALADHKDRRTVILVFQSIQMLCPLALVVLLLTHALQPWAIIALSLIVGITDALSMPAFQSILPLIVGKKEIGRAIAFNSMGFNLARVLGPAFAGWLMARFGPEACFSTNVLSYVPYILVAYWVLPTSKAKPLVEVPQISPIKGEECLAMMRNRILLGAALSVFFACVLCGQVLSFSSVIVKSILHGDASEFGNTLAIFGVGGLLGAALFLLLEKPAGNRLLCSSASMLFGLVLVAIAYSQTRLFLFSMLFLSGALMTLVGTAGNSILLQNAKGARLGQAAAIYMIALRGGLAAGNLLAGMLVSNMGILRYLAWSGGAAVIVQCFIALLWQRTTLKGNESLQCVMPPRSMTA